MDLHDAIVHGASELGITLRMNFAEAEDEVRNYFLAKSEELETRIILDIYGLGAVEWLIVTADASSMSVVADDVCYLHSVRHMARCIDNVRICWGADRRPEEAADVVPLRGDFVKVFAEAADEADWRDLATPAGARAGLARISNVYAEAAAGGLRGFSEWLDSPLLTLRAMTWMLRAQTLIARESGNTDPAERVSRAVSAIDEFVHGAGAASAVLAPAYS